ncbi:hypothetical protein BJX76DRAFT_159391 [Aspergillus varians]
MDFPRLSPPSINIRDYNSDNMSPARSLYTMPGQSFPPQGPVPIRTNTMPNFAPPPLPPPSHIPDLENGYDAGWAHANSRFPAGSAKLAPINPNSSLFGDHRRPEYSVPRSDPMALDELDGRQSGLHSSRSPEAHIKIEPPPPADEGFRNSVTIGNPGPFLKGEHNFSRRSVKDSSHAYDQRVLSRIGKPVSPRQSVSMGTESRSSLSTLPIPSRGFSGLPSPVGSELPSIDLRWSGSSQSGGISPSTKVAWRDYMGRRSPSVESNAPSSTLEYEHHSPFSRDARRRGGGTTPQYDDFSSLPSRSNRGSYDQSVVSDMEGEFTTDESLPPRLFSLREATPPYLDASKSGMKRRASSPPREPVGCDKHQLHTTTSNGDLSQRRTTGHPFTNNLSVNSGYTHSYGSLSAASSVSHRTTASYSSAAPSIGSSITTASTYDRSPGGLSPTSDLDAFHDKPAVNSGPATGSSAQLAAQTTQDSGSLEPSTGNNPRKMSFQTNLNVPKPAATKMSGLYICDCCPKKPKKFDSSEELRAHAMEKQYSCLYCNNRFKNKNEAERHQNSLHLRRHSWSCSALPGYQAAFHPSPSSSAQSGSGASHDSCGYCGEEFPNFPQPNWDQRCEHLTTVHKFGECNNSKKFFRADHFRQHLKHSHAGTSGKWTNILENACMKEEAPPEPINAGSGISSRKNNDVPRDC